MKEARDFEAAERGVSGEELGLTHEGWRLRGSEDLSDSWSVQRVTRILQWVLARCCIVNGGVIWRQIKGIPLGISPSPQLANIFLLRGPPQSALIAPKLQYRWNKAQLIGGVFGR